MRISVILAHPNPESFNHAIAKMAVDAIKTNGHRVFFHDLYQEKFDPRLNLEELADDAILMSLPQLMALLLCILTGGDSLRRS
jgi:putative NADPH-quinone reductase